uniref:TRAP transporter substrate-binding protein n=1 Tax=candidate division WOR-3 bacterium TaxID=2052148 RepID=A0A7C2K1H4_UNCW3
MKARRDKLFKLVIFIVGMIITLTVNLSRAEEITLKYASFFYPHEQGGILAKKFLEAAEKFSGGRIKFKTFFSGALGAPPEYLRLIETGSIDLTTILPPFVQKDMPLFLTVPYALPGGEEKSLKVYTKIVLEHPEAAQIISEEAKQRNIKFLAFVSMGPNVIVSRKVIASLKDLRGMKMGGAEEEWKEFGVVGVSLLPQEGYEALARGLVDAFSMGFTPSIDLKWYEVARCYLFDNHYGIGLPIAINFKRWESLPKDLQDALIKAGKELTNFSVVQAKNNTEEGLKILREKGIEVRYLSKEDTEILFKIIGLKYRRNKTAARAREMGKGKEAERIIQITNKVIEEEYGIRID